MTRRPNLLASGLIALALCGPAFANDPESLTHGPAARLDDWSGLYFGAALATADGDNTWSLTSLADHDLVPAPWTGSAAILSLGHDWQRGRLTFGALVSLGDGSFGATPGDGPFFNCSDCETLVDGLVTLRGRAGFVAGDTLFFGSGGLARATVTATDLGGLTEIASATLDGWTAGLGIEHRIGENLSVAVSYDHIDLGTLDLDSFVPTTESDITLRLMQVGMNVRW